MVKKAEDHYRELSQRALQRLADSRITPNVISDKFDQGVLMSAVYKSPVLPVLLRTGAGLWDSLLHAVLLWLSYLLQ
jgi:hypothetical protein